MNQSNNSETEYFSTENQNRVYEIPAQASYIHQPKQPSGLTPTDSIKLEGQAYRQISSGRSPWWVIFTLWFLIGFPLFLIVLPLLERVIRGILPLFSYALIDMLPLLIIVAIVLAITIRGVLAKR